MAVEMMLMMTTKVAELVSDENLMHVWEAASMSCLLCREICSPESAYSASALNCSSYVPSLLSRFSSQQSLSAHCASAQVLSRVCSSYMPPLLNRPSQLEKKKATLESNLELPWHGFTK